MAAVVNSPLHRKINVAVAVIKREDGKVLFAERPSGKACSGEWEFPGGKVETGESARQAFRGNGYAHVFEDACPGC